MRNLRARAERKGTEAWDNGPVLPLRLDHSDVQNE